MKKFVIPLLAALFLLGAALPASACFAAEAQESTAAEEEVKSGLKKENGSYYYYEEGKKVKKTWETIDGKVYYFGSSGAALTKQWKTRTVSGKKRYYYFGKDGASYTLKWKSRKVSGRTYYYYFNEKGYACAGTKTTPKVMTIGGSTYAFGSNGRALTGVQVIRDKFYYFSSRGKMNQTRTTKLRRASKEKKSVAELKSLLKSYGAKYKKTTYYSGSCYGSGDDGIMKYDGFVVYIFRPSADKKNPIVVGGVQRS